MRRAGRRRRSSHERSASPPRPDPGIPYRGRAEPARLPAHRCARRRRCGSGRAGRRLHALHRPGRDLELRPDTCTRRRLERCARRHECAGRLGGPGRIGSTRRDTGSVARSRLGESGDGWDRRERPRRERQGGRGPVPGRRGRIAQRCRQPALRRAGERPGHEGLQHLGRQDPAPDRRREGSDRRARLQRDLARTAPRRHRGRQGPRDLHEQARRDDRDPLPRPAAAQQHGRRPAHHPGPDPAGRLVHVRVHREDRRVAHVPLAPQRDRPGRTRACWARSSSIRRTPPTASTASTA